MSQGLSFLRILLTASLVVCAVQLGGTAEALADATLSMSIDRGARAPGDCLQPGSGSNETLVVLINLDNPPAPIVGGQFFMQYDPSALDFFDGLPGGDPFTREIYQSANEPAGLLTYIVGVEDLGTGTGGTVTMARLLFHVVAENCEAEALVSFVPDHDPPTRLSGADDGEYAAFLLDLPTLVLDGTPPVISGLTVIGNDTENGCDASVSFSATVTDNCGIDALDVGLDIMVVGGSGLVGPPTVTRTQVNGRTVTISGSAPVSQIADCPVTIEVLISATDSCGNQALSARDTADVGDQSEPSITGLVAGVGPLDAQCQALVTFAAEVSDNCSVNADDVIVDVSITAGNATLGAPSVTKTQITPQLVRISGSVAVSQLEDCPVTVRVDVSALDGCGNEADPENTTVDVTDAVAPVVNGPTVSDAIVSPACQATVNFTATVSDNCGLDPANVQVTITNPAGNATLGPPNIVRIPVNDRTVAVSGSVTVSNLRSCPADVRVEITATDRCGTSSAPAADVGEVRDLSAPVISAATASGGLVDSSCDATVNFSATVADNCSLDPADVSVDLALLTGNATLGPPSIIRTPVNDRTVAVSGSVLVSDLTSCPATVQVTFRAADSCDNLAVPVIRAANVTDNIVPTVSSVVVNGGPVDANCERLVTFSATATDNCRLDAANVNSFVILTTGNAILGVPVVNKTQVNASTVSLSGSVMVSDLLSCPAVVSVRVEATDACGQSAAPNFGSGDVTDLTAPTLAGFTVTGGDVNASCERLVTYSATVADNCRLLAADVTVVVDLPTGNATLGLPATVKTQVDTGTVGISGSVLVSDLLSCPATVRVRITARDQCSNTTGPVAMTADVNDRLSPTLTAPADIAVPADTGECQATFPTLPVATANDNCDASPSITFARSDGKPGLLDPYESADSPVTITWRATDDCGNTATDTQTVTVEGTNELIVNVELSPALDDPNRAVPGDLLGRCITFELWSCPDDAAPSAVVEQQIFFPADRFQPHRTNGVSITVPCGAYNCITARDRLHSLRSTAPDFTDNGTNYTASFVGNRAAGGHWLVGGNLNDNRFIDALDFGIYVVSFQSIYPSRHNDCLTPPFNADITGDGFVFTGDFTFILINFLQASELNCCGQPGRSGGEESEQPVMEIPVADLPRHGLESLAELDHNADAIIDMNELMVTLATLATQSRIVENPNIDRQKLHRQ